MSSIRCSGNAAQLSATNGPLARAEDSCSTRASTSLPAPVGPSIRAVTLARATRWASASKWRLAGSTYTTLRGARMALADGLALTVCDSRIVVTTCQAAGDHSSAGKTCKAPCRMASTTSSRCLRSTRQTIGTLKPKVVVSACSSCSSSMLPPSRTTSRSALSRRS